MQPGTYKLVGIETSDTNAKYGSSFSLEVFDNGFISGSVTFDHWTGDESAGELPLCGNYSGYNYSFKVHYVDTWYYYEGVWGESTCTGSFWEAQFSTKSEAPENRRGTFIHVYAAI